MAEIPVESLSFEQWQQAMDKDLDRAARKMEIQQNDSLAKNIQSLAKKLIGLRLAHEDNLVDDSGQLLKWNRNNLAALKLDNSSEKSQHPVDVDNGLSSGPESDEMRVIGDITYNYSGQQTLPQQTQQPMPVQPIQQQSMPTWQKILLGAALLGGGALAGSMFDDDTDTQYELKPIEISSPAQGIK